jgi:hypothetical protein
MRKVKQWQNFITTNDKRIGVMVKIVFPSIHLTFFNQIIHSCLLVLVTHSTIYNQFDAVQLCDNVFDIFRYFFLFHPILAKKIGHWLLPLFTYSDNHKHHHMVGNPLHRTTRGTLKSVNDTFKFIVSAGCRLISSNSKIQ